MADRVGQQMGNYRLLRVLGHGTFATVYLGEHQYLGRLAAIKVLDVQMEASTHEAFRREAHTIAQLHHPHIISVHDFGFEDQTPYLVMEYTQGGTLRERQPKGTYLPFEQIMIYARQIASALDYAHEQHVIHRDIKPENILLDSNGEVIVSDFGIAVVQSTRNSFSMHHLAGTPIYMAPEQIQQRPGFASDQYALGVMVYEWLCGEPPFLGSLFEVFSQHLHKPPPSLRTRIQGLAPAVEDTVFRVLAKDPQHRFSTVQDFVTVLSEAFFATKSLSPGSEVQNIPSFAHATSPLVPSSSKLAHYSTQPCLKTAQRSEQKPVQEVSVLPQPSIYHQSTLMQRSPVHQKERLSSLQNRKRMLKQVQRIWIDGLLAQSFHHAARVELHLQDCPDRLANPWRLQVQELDQAARMLPSGTTIVQVYDKADGELLILGEPGAGKTTLLLELTRTLLERAEDDERLPMPIVFNLSSWAEKRQSLRVWLVEELRMKYQVPRKVGQAWIDTDQVLPLLDGLDEVAKDARSACVKAINHYYQSQLARGSCPIVVCCRSEEYAHLSTRAILQHVISILPLTSSQINTYLEQAGEQVKGLKEALNEDAELHRLAEQPLMLNIFTLAYQGVQASEVPTGETHEELQRTIFAKYVECVLKRREQSKRWKPEQVIRSLCFLAMQMQRHDLTILFVEYLQPTWLSRRWRVFYRWCMQLIFGLVSGLISGLIFGLILGLIFGLISGLFSGLIFELDSRINTAETLIWSWREALLWLVLGLFSGLILGLAVGLRFPLFDGLVVGLAVGIATGIVGGISSSQLPKHLSLSPNEGLWRTSKSRLAIGLVFWLIFELFYWLIFGSFLWLTNWSLVGLILWLTVGLGAFVKHFLLRFLLSRQGGLPWNLVPFLDEAAGRLLLRKVGGSYVFVHRQLLDYFASLDESVSIMSEPP